MRENYTHGLELDELPFLTRPPFIRLAGGPKLGGLFSSAAGLISAKLYNWDPQVAEQTGEASP